MMGVKRYPHALFAFICASFCVSKGVSINTPPHLLFDREWILTEDEPLDSVVTRVQASDADIGDQVEIYLGNPSYRGAPQTIGDGFTYFKIDSENRIKVAKSLQGLSGQSFLVGVIANDGTVRNRVDAKVTIKKPNQIVKKIPSRLGNSFDPGPSPIGLPYYTTSDTLTPPLLHLGPNTVWKVFADTEIGMEVEKVVANDLTNTFLQYSIYPNDLFHIDPTSGKVTVAKDLRGENGKHNLVIKVSNKYDHITETVTIKVIPRSSERKNNPDYDDNQYRELEEQEKEIEEKEDKMKIDRNKDTQREKHKPHLNRGGIRKPVVTIIEKESPRPTASPGNETTLGYTVILLIFFFGVVPLILVVAFIFLRYRKKKKAKAVAKESSVSYTEKGVSKRDSIMSGLFSMVGLHRRAENNGYEDTANLPKVPSRESNPFRKTSLPATEKNDWEFSRHKLRFLGILGEGCFGQVWKCEATNLNGEGLSLVAVKTLKETSGAEEYKDLIQELKVLKSLGSHPNVVSLLGCCTEKDPVFIILEYMIGGKLQACLRSSRIDRSYNNLHGESSSLTPRDLTIFALQTAKGMDFLSKHGIIHRDLAARNVLIGEGKICKVADFGFARDVANNHVYERKSDGRLPIRWMAPESLLDNIFTTKSDVWSFGILLWEIVTLGSTPYPGIAAQDVVRKVKDGHRLERPEHCSRELYNYMFYCWDVDQDKRPSFSELVEKFEKLIATEVDYIRLDNFPDHNYYNFTSGSATGELL